MNAITRTPRLLLKLPGAPERLSFGFGNNRLNVVFQRLFESIRPSTERLSAASLPEWYAMSTAESAGEVNAWDLCHHIVTHGFGVAGLGTAEFAEPDLRQQWITATPVEHAMAAGRTCDKPTDPDSRLPTGSGCFWFRDSGHSQLEAARSAVGNPADRIRIAHLDTGYDPDHETRPLFLLTKTPNNLQKNFVDADLPNDATDHTSGVFTNLGHGTGTLGILAGGNVDGAPLGGAPFLDVIPIRVANSVVLFENSAIAKALDYVHGLFANKATRAHVITMSMGGLASQAWAEAVNSLYELGVFIVTAAGNNFGNLPTRNIVYPARFRRVVAACGVMADGRPYADLPRNIMAGNYGPRSKMDTALAAFTPNAPWARLGCSQIVDHNGSGTSSATPQIAAAAALWIQKFKDAWEQYTEGWMRVESVRRALFDAARLERKELRDRLGWGVIQAQECLSRQPAQESALKKQAPDSASFPFLRVVTGLGLTAAPDVHHRMLELEALQISQQSQELELLIPDPENPPELSVSDRQRVIDALHEAPGASKTLRAALERFAAPTSGPGPRYEPPKPGSRDAKVLELAKNPPMPAPTRRKLRVFAFDPLLGQKPDFLQINETALDVTWEELQPGPIGEYLEVVDVDPSTGCCYAPVDLNHPSALVGTGLRPSESNPRFHQQMVYAVAMKTIEYFERALGRVALWAPRFVKYEQNGNSCIEKHHVRRLRIYPHALREANSFYSREKKALLLGYFPASDTDPGENLPGGTVFCSLSHDIIAHETTHALLDGLHRYFAEPTNEDVLAFHEAFADIVALFQHFTVPEALRDQIRRTQGDLGKQNMLGELAIQFGQGVGQYGALRSAIGSVDKSTGKWSPVIPKRDDYKNATEPHDRGAVLVAAIFDAFLDIYRRRSADLIRLATSGTGVLSAGEIPNDLVNRLAQEASKTAAHVLNICIRALDYCPPVDLRFGEYLRALITADRDLVPVDDWGYRPAFIQGFRRRGIYPLNVRNLSSESLCWEQPQVDLSIDGMLKNLQLSWDLHADRKKAFQVSQQNGLAVHQWLKNDSSVSDADTEALGFYRGARDNLNGRPGQLRDFEVHSVRPVTRIGPDGQQRTDLVVEITQSWIPADQNGKYRGGCTLIIDLERRTIRYSVSKRVGHPDRMREQEVFQMNMVRRALGFSYFGNPALTSEPFAMIHRGI
ncbi:MAG: S8 family serine peptidase [Verrucomicrobia bacterium]|nr:S8 family serine peptidase [Verrucomicrobiota bacterium]